MIYYVEISKPLSLSFSEGDGHAEVFKWLCIILGSLTGLVVLIAKGHSLIIMPSSDFYHLSDSDLSDDIIAHLKSLPPVGKEWSDPELTPLAKILISPRSFGRMIEAENINNCAAYHEFPGDVPFQRHRVRL